jgi:anti-sigma factor RsiW
MKEVRGMNCEEAKGLIQLYLDDELDARNTLAAQQHLELCDDCSREFNILLAQDRSLRRAAQAQIIDGGKLRADILKAIGRQAPASQTTAKISRLAYRLKLSPWRRAAAVAALAIVAALVVLRFAQTPSINESVCAAMIEDHTGHDSVGNMMGAMIINPEELGQFARTFAQLNATPDLSAFGYDNPQGRICKLDGIEFLHLIYRHPDQEPLSLFICPHRPGLTVEQFAALHRGRFNVVSFSQSGIDLFVVSSLSGERTSAIAGAVASQL